MEAHRVLAANAGQIAEWMASRGGIAVWASVDLSDPGKTWTTPVNGPDGTPAGKPSWQAAETPFRVITDPQDVRVDVPREVKRFRVAIRLGSQGMRYKVTDAGTRRIRSAVAKAGQDAWYEFDYETQQAVIRVPGGTMSLTAWMAAKAAV